MSEALDSEDELQHGERTGRVLKLAQEVVHTEINTVKRIQFWATLAVVVAGIGFGVAQYLNRYASAAEVDKAVEKLNDKAEETRQALSAHIINETQQISELKVITSRGHEDFHYMREQMREVAKVTRGARLVPIPSHPAEGDAP